MRLQSISILIAILLLVFSCQQAEANDSQIKGKEAATPAATTQAAQQQAPVTVANNPQHKVDTGAMEQPKAAPVQSKLLFFINPNGRPCQIQDQIIQSIQSDITAKAQIQYISTTNPNDRPLFYQYGVRSLPQIIVTDMNGSETFRFPPGIQNQDNLLQNIQSH
jgi:hypothetical protein